MSYKHIKIKLFELDKYKNSWNIIEEEVNKFMKDKHIIDVKPSETFIIVMYSECNKY